MRKVAAEAICGTLMKVLAAYAFVGILIAPAWMVANAEFNDRVLWTIFFAVAGFFLIIVAGAIASASPPQAAGPPPPAFVRRNPRLAGTMALALLLQVPVAVLVASALTHVHPGGGLAATIANALVAGGEYLFPVVYKYGTSLSSPLDPAGLLKLQSVISTFLFAGLGMNIVMLIIVSCETDEEALAISPAAASADQWLIMLFLLAVAIMMAADSLFGLFLEFSREPFGKGCYLTANCYGRGSDLDIVGAAMLKALMVFFLPAGLIVMMRERIAWVRQSRKRSRD